jgi:uncharacterized protein YggE
VVAEATTAVKPDLAEVDLGVTTDRPTAAAASATMRAVWTTWWQG